MKIILVNLEAEICPCFLARVQETKLASPTLIKKVKLAKNVEK